MGIRGNLFSSAGMSFAPIGGSASTAAQQAPAVEHGERVIEAIADLSMAAGRTYFLDCLQLGR